MFAFPSFVSACPVLRSTLCISCLGLVCLKITGVGDSLSARYRLPVVTSTVDAARMWAVAEKIIPPLACSVSFMPSTFIQDGEPETV